jgi:hypothetical protein
VVLPTEFAGNSDFAACPRCFLEEYQNKALSWWGSAKNLILKDL